MNPIVKKNAIFFGGIAASISVLYTLIAYLFNSELFVNTWMGLTLMLVNVVLLTLGAIYSKRQMDGYISFKDSFSAFMVAALIGLAASTAMNIIIFGIVDTQAAGEIKELTIEKTISMMEDWNLPEAEIEKAITKIEENDQFGVGSQLQGFMFALALYAVLGLIVAAVTKKQPLIFDEEEVLDTETEN